MPVAASVRAHRQIQALALPLGCGSDRTQNIQFGAARASRLGDQVAAHSGGDARVTQPLFSLSVAVLDYMAPR